MARNFVAAFALLACSLGLLIAPASAQWQGNPPPARFADRHDIQGFVADFDHRFSLTVRADGNYYPIALHQGTIINPTGITLHRGMIVNVRGYWTGDRFQADRINVLR